MGGGTESVLVLVPVLVLVLVLAESHLPSRLHLPILRVCMCATCDVPRLSPLCPQTLQKF